MDDLSSALDSNSIKRRYPSASRPTGRGEGKERPKGVEEGIESIAGARTVDKGKVARRDRGGRKEQGEALEAQKGTGGGSLSRNEKRAEGEGDKRRGGRHDAAENLIT